MKIRLTRNSQVHFTARTESDHCIEIDGAQNIGGQGHGARPMEIVLAGLGGCSAMDVMSTLKKSRQAVSHCEIEIEATRANTVPAVFSHIHILYIISGDNLVAKKVGRAVALSVEKYCSVARMLDKTATITHSFIINQTDA